MSENYFIENRETGKLELHFEKSVYQALTDEQKKEIKSNFLFSRYSSAWVSRCKWPNLYRPKQIAEKLGLEDAGKEGERRTFEEQQEVKAAKAERRADRYDYKSDKASAECDRLQKPLRDMHGDIAFFTQPNINTSSGRAFTRRREKMFEAFDRGFKEFQKSEYYQERAEIARETAKNAKQPESIGFCQRRIEDAEKTIRAQKRNIESYKSVLAKVEKGEAVSHFGGDPYTAEEIQGYIDNAEEIIEAAIDKSVYYHEWIEKLGGIKVNKEDLKPGYIIEFNHIGKHTGRVIRCGSKNVTVKLINDSRFNDNTWFLPYTDIERIAKIPDMKEATPIYHPFKVGDEYTVKAWDRAKSDYVDKVYKVTKITPDKVTVKSGTDRARAITVRQFNYGEYSIALEDNRWGWITKKADTQTT